AFQRQLERLSRDPVVSLLRDLFVSCRLHTVEERPCANRCAYRPPVEKSTRLDRYLRHIVLPLSHGVSAHVAVVAGLRRRLCPPRGVDERWLLDHLASAVADSNR